VIETFGRQRSVLTRHRNLQIPGLVQKGFRVIAPDLRGAINGESDAPQGVQAYNLQKALVKDVAGDYTKNPFSSSRACQFRLGLQRPERLFTPPRCLIANEFPHPVYDQPQQALQTRPTRDCRSDVERTASHALVISLGV